MKPEIYPDPELERETFDQQPTSPPQILAGGLIGFILRTKIQFRLLGALFYILFATQHFHLTIGNIFMVIMCWEIVEIFVFKVPPPNIGLMGLAFGMSGLSPQQVAIATKLFEILGKTSKDIALFMQAFVMTHFAYCKIWLRLDLETIFFAGMMKGGN